MQGKVGDEGHRERGITPPLAGSRLFTEALGMKKNSDCKEGGTR